MTIKEVLNQGKKNLIKNNIEEASLITRMLLSSIIDVKKEELIIKFNEEIKDEKVLEFFNRNRKSIKRVSYSIFNSFKRIYEIKFLCR